MRLALLLPLAFAVAACGSSSASRPSGPSPPRSAHGPPAAWIETKAGSEWLGFSSYCWPASKQSGACADAAMPLCNEDAVPNVQVENGETVRVHLGYEPKEVSVEGAHVKLDGSVASWRIDHPGPFGLFTRATGRDASYVGCAVLR